MTMTFRRATFQAAFVALALSGAAPAAAGPLEDGLAAANRAISHPLTRYCGP